MELLRFGANFVLALLCISPNLCEFADHSAGVAENIYFGAGDVVPANWDFVEPKTVVFGNK